MERRTLPPLSRLPAFEAAARHEISVFRGVRRGNHAETDALLSWLREELAERPTG